MMPAYYFREMHRRRIDPNNTYPNLNNGPRYSIVRMYFSFGVQPKRGIYSISSE